MSTRIAVMEAGEIKQFGTPEEIYDTPRTRFVAGFVGTPSMNFIDMDVTSSHSAVTLTAPGLSVTLPDPYGRGAALGQPGQVTVGVRPEDIVPGETLFQGKIAVVESLGNEQIVTIGLGGAELVLRTAARPKLRIGESLSCGLRTDKLHFFSPLTGERIFSPQTGEQIAF